MKGAKQTKTHYERSRKTNKRSEKSAKLDRKSSRGMIYENEELRLRTININAEVERGQSDIKRLRRENEQLRREIWTLRDECDRLNKRFKAKLNEHEFGGCRGSGGSGGTCHAYRCSGGRGSGGCDVNSDDSDSCDTCRGADDGHCSDDCCQEGGPCAPLKPPLPPEVPVSSKNEDSLLKPDEQQQQQQPIHFDHLSVVSEETLSNPEMLQQFQQQENRMLCTPDLNGSQSTLPSLMGPLTPLTPIEMVANQMNDLHASVPPLSYFENILSQHMGNPNSALTPTPELGSSSSTTTGKTMRHTNGWDYNLQSPFTHRKYSNHTSPSRSPPPPPPATMTTFVPTSTQQTLPKIALNAPHLPVGQEDNIETVAITTNATQQALNSPKHFFAPLKPRLRLNTKLANQSQGQGQGQMRDALPPGSPPPPLRDPPDIFVNNALASPYRRVSPQVSPRRHRAHLHCHAHQHSRQHPSQRHDQDHKHDHDKLEVPQHPQHCALHRAVVDVAAAVGLGIGPAASVSANARDKDRARPHPGSSVLDIYTAALANAAAARCSPLPMPRFAAEPIYATAQKPCQSTCISATALTKPVMTITTNTTKTTTSPSILPAKASKVPSQRENVSQTDSVNLESILNDIETISEDILAIQLEKSKSRDNLSQRQDNDKAKKPYRSEMNLYLQYDGTNPTISPANATTESEAGGAVATTTTSSDSGNSGNSKLMRRTRSLEREHTDSPAPHIPDPMAPFPDKCTYLGFEQINQAAAGTQPSPNGQRPPIGAKPSLAAKPPPPLPPTRRPQMPTEPPPPPPTSASGMSPNKSHLYKTLATAAAKRAIFRSSPSQLTRSLDVELPGGEPETAAEQASQTEADELARRKARRVSILCGAGQAPEDGVAPVTTAPTATASCVDLPTAVLTHPSIKAFKISHSTPSSPHSSRRRTNSNTMAVPGHPEVTATASAPPSTSHHHHHRKESSDPAPMTTATVSRTKCSRRHSEGTVHTVHRNSGASGAGGGGHHHHHNHHHPHSGMAISNNPHHSHHSHQDSNHETATSLSDRNSNSFASSRESSTSFSMRSTRRKISISSHTGGKIPWCGCWGNGCL
ncbi:proline-rich protein 36 isoform X2 [Drosophila guanche]|uniref:proline-rich protein 36 isoform X2 n=1 Tax=Drosophila guanche TaxID=7266 RepID=UPI001472444A|nr:proline-rich protein 36 isoform X2 [Drosophila guanche]